MKQKERPPPRAQIPDEMHGGHTHSGLTYRSDYLLVWQTRGTATNSMV